MISTFDFLARTGIDRDTLEIWIEEEWLIPGRDTGEPMFSAADLARARLILDLRTELGVNREGVGIVLHLVDQLHSLRHAVSALRDARRTSGA
jgi:chaperone modulatory protein CbpM